MLLLIKGDHIRLEKGMKVFTMLPAHCIVANKSSDELIRRDIRIGERIFATGYDTSGLEGEYVVTDARYDGGSHNEAEKTVYPNCYHIFAQKEDKHKGGIVQVDFYQSGYSPAVIQNIKPI